MGWLGVYLVSWSFVSFVVALLLGQSVSGMVGVQVGQILIQLVRGLDDLSMN